MVTSDSADIRAVIFRFLPLGSILILVFMSQGCLNFTTETSLPYLHKQE
jgi:hypothetical protein